MRLPWQAREYERTCATCGYAWRVPRSAVHKPTPRFRRPHGRPLIMGGLNPVVVSKGLETAPREASSEAPAACGQCPQCGGYRYTQRRAPAASS